MIKVLAEHLQLEKYVIIMLLFFLEFRGQKRLKTLKDK